MSADDGALFDATAPREIHRAFLNRYYGISRHFYDLTRKYYLFGRDRELASLARERWTTLLEVGPGTGRNLRKLHRLRPEAKLGGIEASDEMLLTARRSCPFASFSQGFAETANYTSMFGRRPERILFSYCLSMVEDADRAIQRARAELAPGGELVLVDFADFADLPRSFAPGMQAWLRTFHVNPLATEQLQDHGFELSYGPGRYYLRGRLRAASHA